MDAHYFGTDGHGSVRVLYDLAAAIVQHENVAQFFHFDAYGNLLNMVGTAAATSYLYSGEAFDFNIGQQYLRARWYDAAIGRFNRLDPFFGNLTDPQSLHKYAYVHGDPISGIDPTGRSLTIGFNMGTLGLTTLATTVIGGALGFGFGFADALLSGKYTLVQSLQIGLYSGGVGALYGMLLGPVVFGAFFGGGLLQLTSYITLWAQNFHGLFTGLAHAAEAENTPQALFRGVFSLGVFAFFSRGLGKVQFRPSPYWSSKATPVQTRNTGEKVSIFGEGEAEGFTDYHVETDPMSSHMESINGLNRPPTSEIADGAAIDITLRDAPISAETAAEINRIAGPKARFTWAMEAESMAESGLKVLQDFFGDWKVVDQGGAFDGTHRRGVIVVEKGN